MFVQPSALKGPIVLYARVSSDLQQERNTIAGQIKDLGDFCARYNLAISATFTDDGVNGDLPWTERPGASKLLKLATSGQIGTVLVYLYDRFSRSVFEGLYAARELKAAGAIAFSINEPFDVTTPFGEYMFVQSLNNAQLQKAQLLQRTRDGARRKARDGAWLGGVVPYGYRAEGKRPARLLVPDDEHSPILPGIHLTPAGLVRWLYWQMAYEKATTVSLAEKLNALGVPTRYQLDSRRTSSSGPQRGLWQPSTVYNLLVSTTYKGLHKYGKRNGNGKAANPVSNIIERECSALVSADLWDAAQRALKSNARTSRRGTDRRYLLSGLIRCGYCGRYYTGKTFSVAAADATDNRRGVIYCCNSLQLQASVYSDARGGKRQRCCAPSLPGGIEHLVWGEILDFLRSPEEAAVNVAAAQSQSGEDVAGVQAEVDRLNQAIDAKQAERAVVLAQLRRGRITEAEYDDQIAEVDREKAALLSNRQRLDERLKAASNLAEIGSSVQATLRSLRDRLSTADDPSAIDWETKRQIVTGLVAEIIVTAVEGTLRAAQETGRGKRRGEAQATIKYRFDLSKEIGSAGMAGAADAGSCSSSLHNKPCTVLLQHTHQFSR